MLFSGIANWNLKSKDRKIMPSLCERVKKDQHIKDTEKYWKKVNKPEFLCKKCGRVANKEKDICKAIPISVIN